MGCANTRACCVSVTETSHGHQCLCLPHHQIPFWRWTGSPPAVGGVCSRSPLLDRALVVGGVCSRVPVTGLRPSPRGSLPWAQSPGPVCASPETRRTLPVSVGSQPTSHLLRQCPPTAPRHEDLSASPMLSPTHFIPPTLLPGQSLTAGGSVWCLILSAQRCPAGCQKKLWEWMADVTDRWMTGCLRPVRRKEPGSERWEATRWPCRTGTVAQKQPIVAPCWNCFLACFSLLLLL